MYGIEKKYLTPNSFSRAGGQIKQIKGIVVHWVQNTGTSALLNWLYFELRKAGRNGYGSAHYIIDQDGTVLQAIPDDEVAYHVGADSYTQNAKRNLSSYPNDCTLGIECTHYKDNGEMKVATYKTLVELAADLLLRYRLDPDTALYRHYDITGKICHKWFVDNPDEWENFKIKVKRKCTEALS